MEGIPMRSAGISTSDRERTGIREGALFSCRICRMYGVYGSPACWYAGLLYLKTARRADGKDTGMGYIEKTYGRSEKFLAFKVCFYDTLVPAREYKSGYAADRFARKCAAQGLWCSLHGLAVADGSCEWVEISAC